MVMDDFQDLKDPLLYLLHQYYLEQKYDSVLTFDLFIDELKTEAKGGDRQFEIFFKQILQPKITLGPHIDEHVFMNWPYAQIFADKYPNSAWVIFMKTLFLI
jgi:hypothetical protein